MDFNWETQPQGRDGEDAGHESDQGGGTSCASDGDMGALGDVGIGSWDTNAMTPSGAPATSSSMAAAPSMSGAPLGGEIELGSALDPWEGIKEGTSLPANMPKSPLSGPKSGGDLVIGDEDALLQEMGCDLLRVLGQPEGGTDQARALLGEGLLDDLDGEKDDRESAKRPRLFDPPPSIDSGREQGPLGGPALRAAPIEDLQADVAPKERKGQGRGSGGGPKGGRGRGRAKAQNTASTGVPRGGFLGPPPEQQVCELV